MLGFKHDTGKKIYDLLNNIYNNIECEILNSESILYRGRTRKEDRPAFKDNEMWNPPDGITSHGRYNQIGISVLYCSTKQKVLPYEIHAGLDDIVEIVKFKLKENMKILDVDDVFEEFDGFFNSNYVESKELKKKYLLPNYIRDCCKDIGYNGIAYRSVHDDSCKNYALINFKEDINIELISHTYKKFKVCYRSQRINT
nr:RES family NAD+ phosphorylase [Clostridium beijerinckii]